MPELDFDERSNSPDATMAKEGTIKMFAPTHSKNRQTAIAMLMAIVCVAVDCASLPPSKTWLMRRYVRWLIRSTMTRSISNPDRYADGECYGYIAEELELPSNSPNS